MSRSLLTSPLGPHGLRERVSWTDLEGGDLHLRAQSNSSPKYRTKAGSLQQEKRCSEKAAHRQERKPHSKGHPAQGKLQNNFKYGVSFKIQLKNNFLKWSVI